MNTIVSVCIFGAVAMVAMAAPAVNDVVEPQNSEENTLNTELLRQKRSQYGAPSYAAPAAPSYGAAAASYGGAAHSYGGAAPCAGPYSLPAIAPLSPSYLPIHGAGYGSAPAHSYGSYGYGGPHYRAEDMGDDHSNFPEAENMMSEHFPMARYGGYGGYGPLPAAHGLPAYGPAVASGPAYGVFPNANVGGCNVPLLLSCSPSIVPGRLVKTGYGGYGAAPAMNAYRGVDEGHAETHEEHAHHEEHEAVHDQVAAVNESSHSTSSHQ